MGERGRHPQDVSQLLASLKCCKKLEQLNDRLTKENIIGVTLEELHICERVLDDRMIKPDYVEIF